MAFEFYVRVLLWSKHRAFVLQCDSDMAREPSIKSPNVKCFHKHHDTPIDLLGLFQPLPMTFPWIACRG
jgi:hypothetical protein